jgi:hypothetical protein
MQLLKYQKNVESVKTLMCPGGHMTCVVRRALYTSDVDATFSVSRSATVTQAGCQTRQLCAEVQSHSLALVACGVYLLRVSVISKMVSRRSDLSV